MDIKEALTFDGLKYFYTTYIKSLKSGAFATVVNNATTTVANTVLDGRMGKTLADKDANLQSQINTLNSTLAKNFDVDRVSLTNSSYYPTSFLYRSGQVVNLRCSGVTKQEVPAGNELVVAIESNTPETFRPISDIVAYANITEEKRIRLYISKEGRITLKSSEKLVKGFGINLHFTYITGRAIM